MQFIKFSWQRPTWDFYLLHFHNVSSHVLSCSCHVMSWDNDKMLMTLGWWLAHMRLLRSRSGCILYHTIDNEAVYTVPQTLAPPHLTFLQCEFLDTQVSLAPTHVSWLVSWLVRWSHFRISYLWSVTVDQIKKVQKTKSIYFQILPLGGSSPPTKMYMKA